MRDRRNRSDVQLTPWSSCHCLRIRPAEFSGRRNKKGETVRLSLLQREMLVSSRATMANQRIFAPDPLLEQCNVLLLVPLALDQLLASEEDP